MIVTYACGCKSRSDRNLFGPIAWGATWGGNPPRRSLPTRAPLGRLRKRAGRNANEPTCSVVTCIPRSGGGPWECRASGRMAKTGTFHRGTGHPCDCWGIGARPERIAHPSPEVVGIVVDRLPGVSGMACVESVRSESWEIQTRSRPLPGNRPSGAECSIWKSERSIVVMTAGTTQPRTSEGAVLSQRLYEKRRLANSSLEVSYARG